MDINIVYEDDMMYQPALGISSLNHITSMLRSCYISSTNCILPHWWVALTLITTLQSHH